MRGGAGEEARSFLRLWLIGAKFGSMKMTHMLPALFLAAASAASLLPAHAEGRNPFAPPFAPGPVRLGPDGKPLRPVMPTQAENRVTLMSMKGALENLQNGTAPSTPLEKILGRLPKSRQHKMLTAVDQALAELQKAPAQPESGAVAVSPTAASPSGAPTPNAK